MERRERFGQALSRTRAGGLIPRWMWWIVTGFPALFVLVGFGILAEAINYTGKAGSTWGMVVDVSAKYGSESGVSYLPTIRYRRDDGRVFEAVTNSASSGYDYAIGERVDILYSYDNPEEVRIDSFFSLYGAGIIVIVAGALFIRIITWVRRKIDGGAVLGRVAEALAERMQEAAREQKPGAGSDRKPEPRTPKAPKREHVHKPRPERTPTIRRMR